MNYKALFLIIEIALGFDDEHPSARRLYNKTDGTKKNCGFGHIEGIKIGELIHVMSVL
jgi:hypothetical protein